MEKKKPRIFLNITLLNSRAVSVNILFSFSTRNHVKLCGNFCQHTCSGGLKMFSSLFFSLWRIQLYLENCSFLSDAEIIKRCQFHVASYNRKQVFPVSQVFPISLNNVGQSVTLYIYLNAHTHMIYATPRVPMSWLYSSKSREGGGMMQKDKCSLPTPLYHGRL